MWIPAAKADDSVSLRNTFAEHADRVALVPVDEKQPRRHRGDELGGGVAQHLGGDLVGRRERAQVAGHRVVRQVHLTGPVVSQLGEQRGGRVLDAQAGRPGEHARGPFGGSDPDGGGELRRPRPRRVDPDALPEVPVSIASLTSGLSPVEGNA